MIRQAEKKKTIWGGGGWGGRGWISLVYFRVVILPNARRHSQPCSSSLIALCFFPFSLCCPIAADCSHVSTYVLSIRVIQPITSTNQMPSSLYTPSCMTTTRVEERHLDVPFHDAGSLFSLPLSLCLKRTTIVTRCMHVLVVFLAIPTRGERKGQTMKALIYIYICTPVIYMYPCMS